jgi:hypothetical protein
MKDQKVCRMHGGNSPNALRGAGQRAVKARHLVIKKRALEHASRMLAQEGAAEGVDPAAMLISTVAAWDALAHFWGELCAQLDLASDQTGELRGQLHYSEASDPLDVLTIATREQLLGLNRHGEAQIHPFVIEFKDALKERAKAAKMCLDAGIAERRVQLAEAQGQLVVTAIRGLVVDLERVLGEPILSRSDFPAMVRRHLALAAS